MSGNRPDFIQDGPRLSNTYETDDLLRAFLKWKIGRTGTSETILTEVESDLQRFGARCATDLLELSRQAEASPPRLVQFDPWGRRLDHIEVSSAWQALDRISAEEGLIAIGYERTSGEFSRLHQFAKIYLFHPSSAFYSCPLAMTDGAARVLELHGSDDLKAKAFRHLTSRDPAAFWTSGQWMTEKTGGSDVSGTSTVAKSRDGHHALHGDKWFTSATTSQMTLALAKVEGAQDAREGLSLFYVELRDRDGRLQNIRINRLKDKLGTKALPTAELTLDGTPATIIGETGEGVKRISSLLNITRLYNATCSIGTIARSLALAKDYAKKRVVFGKRLSEQPLHLQTLADLETEFQATLLTVFHLAHLLGREETGSATVEDKAVLRLLTPVIKLWSAKQAIAIVSEVIESFGGAGYIEDTGLPGLLRDAQVFSIWEGTTNVLSLDASRAISKDGSLKPFFLDLERRLQRLPNAQLSGEIASVRKAASDLESFFRKISTAPADAQQAGARAAAFGIARVHAASLSLEFAVEAEPPSSGLHKKAWLEKARRFCRKPLFHPPSDEDLDATALKEIVFPK
jgi:putative acyl-CoA dehydrogenase